MADEDPAIITVTDESFSEIVKTHPRMVIDCWAPWCGPCRMIAPMVEELAKEYEGKMTFGKLNIDNNENLSRMFGIMGIPTLLFIKDGELADRIVGAIPKSHIIDKIGEVFQI